MLVRIPTAAAALVAVCLLAGCASGPQQPSDAVDDKSAQIEPHPTFRDLSNLQTPGVDPTTTGSVGADLSSISGRWAESADRCGTEGAPVTISPTRFASIERICDVTDTIDGGNGSVTATLLCPRGDGLADSELVKLSPTQNGLDMSFIGGDGTVQSLVKCP